MCASKFPSPPANVYTSRAAAAAAAAAAEMHPTHNLLLHHVQQCAAAAGRVFYWPEGCLCLRITGGACTLMTGSLQALNCGLRAVCAPLCTDLTWGSSFLPETFRAPQCLLFVKKMHLPKQTILAPFRPMFESQLCAHLRHRRSDLYCSTSTIFIILILDLTTFVLFSSCIPII